MVLASLNINSLLLHKDELASILLEKGIHIMALNETKLDKKMPKNILAIPNYKLEREDRNRHGGGVAVYIRDSIKHTRREDIPKSGLELVCVEVQPVKASPFLVIAWYRPPSEPVASFEKLEQVLQYLENEDKEIILLGDINCDLLQKERPLHNRQDPLVSDDSNPGTTYSENSLAKKVLELYNAYGLKQLINQPTRETLNTSTLIDHIAISDHRNIVESGVLSIALSDHYMIYCVRKFRGALKGQHKKITTRQMKHFDETKFLDEISSIDWNSALQSSVDLDSAVENVTSLLSLVIEKHAPMRQRRVSEKYCPWITSDLRAFARSRDKLKKSAVKTGSAILMEAYRHLRNKVNSLNTRLKREYFSEKICANEGNLKETWSAINQLINKRSKTTNITSLTVDGKSITKKIEIADSMNDFFCNIGENLSSKIPDTANPLVSGDYSVNNESARFEFQMISPENLVNIMTKFKKSYGFGVDGISSFFLKIAMPVIAPVLCDIFNWSLASGTFPQNWKIARVSPIYKDGNIEDRSNYRPISVLPVVSRLFEKIIFDQMYTYFVANKLFFSGQSGFRALHSVLTCLLKCTNDWYMNFDKGLFTGVILIDLKKAFDTVDHDILIAKLCRYGVIGNELDWFKSYLSNRKQCCKVNGHVSKLQDINCGVPQGSCLGPLLFLIYVNDLPFALDRTKATMYADDTSISYSSKYVTDLTQVINTDLNNIRLWLMGNKLSLNVAKTQSMILGSGVRLRKLGLNDTTVGPDFQINEDRIAFTSNVKYLGVQIDSQLSWKEHITVALNKISRGVGMLKYSKKYLSLETVQKMYLGIVEPHIRYCCSVWGCAGDTIILKLQKLQNRAARIVTNSPFDKTSLPLIAQLGWLNVKEMVDFETATIVYKSLHELAPPYMQDMFHKLSDSRNRVLRNTETDLRIPLCKTSNGQRSFSYRGVTVWNQLSSEIKTAQSLAIFKNRLKTFLKSNRDIQK